MRPVVIGLWAALLAPAGLAGAEPITIGERLKLTSKVMGEERTILVSTPPTYGQGTERYPVLYMTDGDAHLSHTRGTVDFLVRNGLMPDVVIVGVTNTDRTRDLSPTHAFRTREDGTREEVVNSGGAGKFLDFFAQELIPHVDAHYRTLPYRILAGHSLGALFTLHALVARPEIFDAHISASPSLNWDEEYILREAARVLGNPKPLPRTLFVTMANEEEGTPAPTRFDRLLATLRGAKKDGFAWDARLMADETHGSVVLRTHYWGLRKVFEGWNLPRDPRTRRFAGNLADLQKHYLTLSRRFGFEVPPPETTVNEVGYQFLRADDVQGALAFFRYNAERYPASANVHDSLGEALERAGQKPEALASYERAVENARKTGDQRLEAFTRNRDRLAAAVKE